MLENLSHREKWYVSLVLYVTIFYCLSAGAMILRKELLMEGLSFGVNFKSDLNLNGVLSHKHFLHTRVSYNYDKSLKD